MIIKTKKRKHVSVFVMFYSRTFPYITFLYNATPHHVSCVYIQRLIIGTKPKASQKTRPDSVPLLRILHENYSNKS